MKNNAFSGDKTTHIISIVQNLLSPGVYHIARNRRENPSVQCGPCIPRDSVRFFEDYAGSNTVDGGNNKPEQRSRFRGTVLSPRVCGKNATKTSDSRIFRPKRKAIFSRRYTGNQRCNIVTTRNHVVARCLLAFSISRRMFCFFEEFAAVV